MTTRDMGTLLSEALHVESDDASISDPHTAVLELQRAIQRNRRRRGALVLASAAAAVALAATGAGVLTSGDDRAAPPPTVSPDPKLPPPGHRIVFSALDGEVMVVDDRGGKPVPVLEGREPRFDLVGSRLAYVDGRGRLAVASVDQDVDRRSRRLDEPPPSRPDEGAEGLYGPLWSPDGHQIAYMANSQLRLVDVATGDVEQLRDFDAPYVRPMDWTPDGTSLLLGFDRSTTGGELVVEAFDLSTGRLTPLLGGAGETSGVRYSPDGSQLAFYSDSRQCLCTSDVIGRHVTTVLDLAGQAVDSARLAWSPDGTRLAWDERSTGRVHLLDLSTGRDRLLADGVADKASAIDWDRP